MEDKKYVKLLELGEKDAFHHAKNVLVDFSVLIGRVFEVGTLIEDDEDGWSIFSGNLVGDTLGTWDNGYYAFAYAKVEEVSKEALM